VPRRDRTTATALVAEVTETLRASSRAISLALVILRPFPRVNDETTA
jgi:hypothetical protein